jgi:sugar lactone lactonase YvrE
MSRDIHTVLGGYTYFEAPRWHEGRLWVSDLYTHQVLSLSEDGSDVRVEATLDVPPAGLGWLPDGRLLVTSTQDSRLLRREADGSLVVHADLSGLTRGWLNDFAVDGAGRAFVGHFGFDLFAGEPLAPGSIIRVDPDGHIAEVAGDVFFPNGSVITADGRLLVGETFGNRVSAFRIQEDGSLTDRTTWAQFGELAESDDVFTVLGSMAVASDGCTLDDEGALWIADIAHGRVVRVSEGGEILEELHPGAGVFACVLGGADGRTLFLCTAPDFNPEARAAGREAAIQAVRVEVASVGVR